MEELDRQIVDLLVKDGRMSYTDLGKATGLSTSAVHQRVRRLEQRGVVRGYAAIVDPEAVGLPLTAFISVKPFDPSAPDDIADRLAEVPELEACHSVAGDENYILKVRVATPLELEHLLTRIRTLAGCLDPHHGRALHALRGPPAAHLTGDRPPARGPSAHRGQTVRYERAHPRSGPTAPHRPGTSPYGPAARR